MQEKPVEYVEKKATSLKVMTTVGVFEGLFYHAPGTRLTDAIRNMTRDERYLPLSDVVLRPLGAPESEPIERAPFALVNFDEAILVIPMEE